MVDASMQMLEIPTEMTSLTKQHPNVKSTPQTRNSKTNDITTSNSFFFFFLKIQFSALFLASKEILDQLKRSDVLKSHSFLLSSVFTKSL